MSLNDAFRFLIFPGIENLRPVPIKDNRLAFEAVN